MDSIYVFPGHSVASDESFTNTNHVGLHSQQVLREIMGHSGDVNRNDASHFSDILSSLQFSSPSFITLCLNGLQKCVQFASICRVHVEFIKLSKSQMLSLDFLCQQLPLQHSSKVMRLGPTCRDVRPHWATSLWKLQAFLSTVSKKRGLGFHKLMGPHQVDYQQMRNWW